MFYCQLNGHAYFAMISYLDEQIGNLLSQLEQTGLRENTVVMFTSDHGEMLGQRGMWFKQCFWEWSARVPLIISTPNGCKNTFVEANTSLVDLLPTQIALTGESENLPYEMIAGLAGRDLGPMLIGDKSAWPNCVISDYLAIGPCVPCRMIKKDHYKYIYAHGQPDLLFNLSDDPKELTNLAASSQHNTVLSKMKKVAMHVYNPEALMAEVISRQGYRRFVATIAGKKPSWDYVAYQGDAERYVRRDGVNATKSRLRLPRAATVPPDLPDLSAKTIDQMMAGDSDFDF